MTFSFKNKIFHFHFLYFQNFFGGKTFSLLDTNMTIILLYNYDNVIFNQKENLPLSLSKYIFKTILAAKHFFFWIPCRHFLSGSSSHIGAEENMI